MWCCDYMKVFTGKLILLLFFLNQHLRSAKFVKLLHLNWSKVNVLSLDTKSLLFLLFGFLTSLYENLYLQLE